MGSPRLVYTRREKEDIICNNCFDSSFCRKKYNIDIRDNVLKYRQEESKRECSILNKALEERLDHE